MVMPVPAVTGPQSCPDPIHVLPTSPGPSGSAQGFMYCTSTRSCSPNQALYAHPTRRFIRSTRSYGTRCHPPLNSRLDCPGRLAVIRAPLTAMAEPPGASAGEGVPAGSAVDVEAPPPALPDCRICHETDLEANLVSPCDCKGTGVVGGRCRGAGGAAASLPPALPPALPASQDPPFPASPAACPCSRIRTSGLPAHVGAPVPVQHMRHLRRNVRPPPARGGQAGVLPPRPLLRCIPPCRARPARLPAVACPLP